MSPADRISVKPVLIFDLDGTLVDTTPAHSAAFSEIFEEIGITDFEYARFAGRRTEDVFREVLASPGIETTVTDIRDLVRRKQTRAVALIEQSRGLLPGAAGFLERMAEAGKRMALATSASRRGAKASLRVNDIEKFFEAVVTGDDVSAAKPAPDIYLKAVDDMNCRAARCIVFEDSKAGYEAAVAAGLETIVVAHKDRAEAPAWVPQGVSVTNFTQLLKDG